MFKCAMSDSRLCLFTVGIEVDDVQHPDAWRSLLEDDLLHASAHRVQLKRKGVVCFDPRWMRCHWPEELVPRHGTKSGCSLGR